MMEDEVLERDESPDVFGDEMSAGRAKNSKATLKRFIRELGSQKLQMITIIFCLAVAAACSLIAPYFVGKVITDITNGALTNYVTANPEIIFLYPEIVPEGYVEGATFAMTFDNVDWQIVLIAGLYTLASLTSYISSYTLASVSQKISLNMRKRISDKLNKLPLKFYDTHKKGDILSRVTSDIDRISDNLQETMSQMFTAVMTILGAFIAMFVISWQLALIALLTVVVSTVVAGLIAMRTQRYYVANQKALGALNANIEEVFTGNNIIRAFNLQDKMTETNDALNEKMKKASTKAQFITYAINPIIRLMGQIGYVLIAAFGASLVLKGTLAIGTIVSVFMYVSQVSEPVTELAYTINMMQGAIASAERVYEIEDELEEVPDKTQELLLGEPQGSVAFDHVRFGYSDDKILMQDININVTPGSKIAIVGPTGAGKTTLVNLLMRFYELQGGKISIDGVNVADMSRKELRSTLGMVLQDTWLFNGTIADNIAYGKKDATFDEVQRAAKAARIDRFIRTLPDGYNTVLDDEVVGISAGQKQLLTIARAMLADPAILILDEATSSVDTRTEIEIQKAMNKLMQGRTSFVIAHRLSTIKDSDLILVMRDGTIVEQGTHNELIAQNRFYAELYNSQFATKVY
ncbi:MAG: ABC transporter ATP-binding protein/permease [Muribaculaceae bacterium]|nr:ABC transporter ATP-binding protein/permease [Muribaculaceae bacterium]MCM1556386.1 ABC transporter ATP-binding protein/permease [Anaeroplasma bactoclasticum]